MAQPARILTLPANLGRFVCPLGTFTPTARPVWHGARPNPITTEPWATRTLAGHLYVGLRVGTRRKRKIPLKRLVALVKRMRLAQVDDPGATFVSQLGVFRHRTGEIVEEPSVRVIIFAVESLPKLRTHLRLIAEAVITALHQESVIGEITKSGVTVHKFCTRLVD